MRLKGKLIKWDNEKAFGFIVPNSGGAQVFIHKTAFKNHKRHPQINDVITFSISKDKQGRYCADKATFSGEKINQVKVKSVNKFSIYLSVVFLALIVTAFMLGYIQISLVLVYLGVNFLTFILYAYDKSKAKHGTWRISESTLHFFALTGGWPGAAIAQQMLRHKSQKKEFRFLFWLTVVANLSVLFWLIPSNGEQLMSMFKSF